MAQGLTLEQLQGMGAKPTQSGGLTLDQLNQMKAPVAQPQKTSLPLVSKQSSSFSGNFVNSLYDQLAGAGKSAIRGTVDVAGGLQSLGKGALGLLGGDTSQLGFKSLDSATPQGQGVQDILQPTSQAQKIGGYLETAGELGAGFVKKGIPAIQKGYEALQAGKEAKGITKAFDAITPLTKDITPTEYESLLRQGKILPKTATQAPQYVLSEGEKVIATKYKNLLQNPDPVKNSINLIDEIVKKDTEVGTFLKKNNAIFNNGELKNFVTDRLQGVSDVMIPDARINKLKNTIVDGFIKSLPKNNMETLWKSRKAFDKSIEKVFSGSPTLQNTIKKEFRNAIQDYIAEKTPDKVYSTAMKDMTELFRLQETVAQKAIKEKGRNAIQVWLKNNPTKAKIIGGTIGTGIVGAVGSSILNN